MSSRRFAALLVALAFAAAGCRSDSPTIVVPSETGTPSPTGGSPSPTAAPTLAGASCEPTTGGSSSNTPHFVDVDTARSNGVESITFEFAAATSGEAPSFGVEYVDELTGDPSGEPVEIEGEAFLQVHFGAIATDLSGETPVQVYAGPRDIPIGFPVLRQAKLIGDFEAVVTWGIGLSSRQCFVAEADADSLTISVASA